LWWSIFTSSWNYLAVLIEQIFFWTLVHPQAAEIILLPSEMQQGTWTFSLQRLWLSASNWNYFTVLWDAVRDLDTITAETLVHHKQLKLNQSRSPVTSRLLSLFCQRSWILPRFWGLVFFSKYP
jgi:hypothetical protein